MNAPQARAYWDDRGMTRLWLGLASGPVAWALDLLIGYALVKPVCRADARFTLVAVSAAALLVTAAGWWLSWRCLQQLRNAHPTGGHPEDRSQMLALAGVVLNALLALLIVTAAVSQFLLSPCE